MSDYFLVDPDYKDFDFTDRDKLKFVTVYGEKNGRILEAIFVIIVSVIAIMIMLTAFFHETTYLLNGTQTFGIVNQACQISNSEYTYSFEAEDTTGNPRQFTGRTITDKDTPCRKVGESIRVEYLKYDPSSSHEITGGSHALGNLCVIWFIFIFCGYGIYVSSRSLRAFIQARPKYERLKKVALIIGGKITDASEVSGPQLARGGYYIEVGYEFQHDRQILHGTQIKRRDDLKGKRLPPKGTPVRVVYADDNAYLML